MFKDSRRFLNSGLALALLWSLSSVANAEMVQIAGPNGKKIKVEIHQPPDFDSAQEYSILIGPGGFYWEDRPSQPGWITVSSGAFWGKNKNRMQESKAVLTWLREEFKPKNGGFHMAGWSANSAGIFEIAMTFPGEFLSVSGIAGMPGRKTTDADLRRLRSVRVQFIVGEKDDYWRQGSERWHAKMQHAGIRSTLEIVPGAGHVMPEIANEPFFQRLNQLVESIGREREDR